MNRVFIIGGRSYNVSDPTIENLSLAGKHLGKEIDKASGKDTFEEIFDNMSKETLCKALSCLISGDLSLVDEYIQQIRQYRAQSTKFIMRKKPQPSFETNKPFTLRVLYSGHGVYEVVFSYQKINLFQPLSDQQYREYRKLCYLYPVGAKNYLLDLICFERTSYQRKDFEFWGKDEAPTKEMIALWQEIEKCL